MNFHLRYSGPLPGKEKGSVEIKHRIRECFNEQLTNLIEDRDHVIGNATYGNSYAKVIRGIAFFPLVTSDYNMFCELDIQFFRRELPGNLISSGEGYGGDLDNRIKILFDALRMPSDEKEVPKRALEESETGICYCLLQDDALITKFQVESLVLLGKVTPENQKDVDLIIDAKVKIDRITEFNKDIFR